MSEPFIGPGPGGQPPTGPQVPPNPVPGQLQPGQVPPGYAPPGQVPPGYAPSGQVPPGYAPSGQVPPGYAPSGQVPPGYAPPGQVPPGYAVPGHGHPGGTPAACSAAAFAGAVPQRSTSTFPVWLRWGAAGVVVAAVLGVVLGGLLGSGVTSGSQVNDHTAPTALPSPFPGDTPYLPGLTMTWMASGMRSSVWRCRDEADTSPLRLSERSRSCMVSMSMKDMTIYYDDETHVRAVRVHCLTGASAPHACDQFLGEATELVFSGTTQKAMAKQARAWVAAHGRSDETTQLGNMIIAGSVEGDLRIDTSG